MTDEHKKTNIKKVGYLCLILAIISIALYDMTILIILGFLFYTYKSLYKKEELKTLDKIIIIILCVLLILSIFLSVYLSSLYTDIYEEYEYLITD